MTWVRDIRVRLSDEVVATSVLLHCYKDEYGVAHCTPTIWVDEQGCEWHGEPADSLLIKDLIKDAILSFKAVMA